MSDIKFRSLTQRSIPNFFDKVPFVKFELVGYCSSKSLYVDDTQYIYCKQIEKIIKLLFTQSVNVYTI